MQDPALLNNIVEVSAGNEVALAQKISRIRSLLPGEAHFAQASDIECERFPDQCPCTTELGKGVA